MAQQSEGQVVELKREECVPYRHGVPLALAVIAGMTLLTAGLSWPVAGNAPPLIAVAVWGLLYSVFAVGFLEATWGLPQNHRRRNIIGFNEVHYLDEAMKICTKIVPRNAKLEHWPFAISIPLGGWFNRPRAFGRAFIGTSWRLRRVRKSADAILFLDDEGCRLRLRVDDALWYLSCIARGKPAGLWPGAPMAPCNWSHLDLCLRTCFKEITKAYTEQRTELCERAHDVAVMEMELLLFGHQMATTINAIDRSKRFVRSKDGERIRKELVGWLEHRLVESPWLCETVPTLAQHYPKRLQV